METPMHNGKGNGVLAAPERNHYFYGKLLDVQQLQKEQRYFIAARRRLNRLVLGHGVVCGLSVVPDTAGLVRIQPGVALDAWGREIVVPEAVGINPHQLTDDQGRATGEPIATGTVVELCLAYAEKKTDPVPVLVPDCDTPGNCAPSTIREGFYVIVRLAEGVAPAPPSCQFGDFPLPAAGPLHDLLCERLSAPCPEPPADPCVPLARVTLTLPLNEGSINTHAGRRLVYSNALLYELLICLAERVGQIAGGRLLRYVSGDGQAGQLGTQLSAPLILEVVDGEGKPMRDVRVEFEATADGSTDPTDAMTDQDGQAQTQWTLGPAEEEQQVIARAVGTAFTVTFRATAVPE